MNTKELLVYNGFIKIDQLNWKPIENIAYIKNTGGLAKIFFDDGHFIDVYILEGGILPLLRKLRGENADMYANLFNDNYFKGLTPEQVIGLAKKSIRITAYNRELENTLEKIGEECNEAPMCDTEFSERVLEIINEVLK